MQSSYNYKRFAILYVDDEEKSLKYFQRAFGDEFRILTASNAQVGMELLEANKDEIAILMTDQRMPGERGVWLLEKARQLRPETIRILATAYTDMEAAIEAVNSGAIYKYVNKPWDPPQLEQTLKRGYEFFVTQRERDQLLREKMSVLRNMVVAEHTMRLGLLAAGMSHHVRNSLVAVKTFLDLAPAKVQEEKEGAELRDADFWKEYHGEVQGQLAKINQMLKDLWVASENNSLEFRDYVRLREIVHVQFEKSKLDFAAKNISVHNNVPDSLPDLLVDGAKFSRIFELLFKDEIASLPPGSGIEISAATSGDEIEIKISDNGPGLPGDALKLVFDPFALRADTPREYGIHLMGCFFIVHHHGGTIQACSEGSGTTFLIRLPLDPNKNAISQGENGLLEKIMLNDKEWEKLVASR